jgi:hypothetical protein
MKITNIPQNVSPGPLPGPTNSTSPQYQTLVDPLMHNAQMGNYIKYNRETGHTLPAFNWNLTEAPLKGNFTQSTEVFLDTYPKPDGTTGRMLSKSLRLPNVRRFKVAQLGDYHPVFKAFGHKKRMMHPLFDMSYYDNRKLNRYIEHQILRLNGVRDNPTLFWRIGLSLLLNSKIFTIVNLHATYPTWYKDQPYQEIWKILAGHRKLRNKESFLPIKLSYLRLLIPKATGGTRPLSVPSKPWRVILRGLYVLLTIWLSPYWAEQQHGFYPKRGCVTAWTALHRVLENPQTTHILEFDLNKYFDSINLTWLTKLLHSVGTPELITSWLDNLNRSLPANYGPDTKTSLDFKDEDDLLLTYKHYKTGIWGFSCPDLLKGERALLRESLERDPHPNKRIYEHYYGLPQGWAHSPLLSGYLLSYNLLRPGNQVIQYADDGVLYGDSDQIINLLNFSAESGISVNWTKSQWVKFDGKTLSPLKFLGQQSTLDAGDVTQYNATRTPKWSHLTPLDQTMIRVASIYDDQNAAWQENYNNLLRQYHRPAQVIENWDPSKPYEGGISLEDLLKHLPNDNRHPKYSYTHYFESKYAGLCSALIYNGSIDADQLQQDFSLGFHLYSWTHLEQKRQQLSPILGQPYILNGRDETDLKLTTFNISSFATRALHQRYYVSSKSSPSMWSLPNKPLSSLLSNPPVNYARLPLSYPNMHKRLP